MTTRNDVAKCPFTYIMDVTAHLLLAGNLMLLQGKQSIITQTTVIAEHHIPANVYHPNKVENQ